MQTKVYKIDGKKRVSFLLKLRFCLFLSCASQAGVGKREFERVSERCERGKGENPKDLNARVFSGN